MNLLMLVCATLASLALGLLVAYGMCRAAFAMLRQHAGSMKAKTQVVAPVSHADSA